jgi:hypothetical protein
MCVYFMYEDEKYLEAPGTLFFCKCNVIQIYEFLQYLTSGIQKMVRAMERSLLSPDTATLER